MVFTPSLPRHVKYDYIKFYHSHLGSVYLRDQRDRLGELAFDRQAGLFPIGQPILIDLNAFQAEFMGQQPAGDKSTCGGCLLADSRKETEMRSWASGLTARASQHHLFSRRQLDDDRVRDVPRYLVLQRQQVAQLALLALGRDVLVRSRVDQLGGYPHVVTGTQHGTGG